MTRIDVSRTYSNAGPLHQEFAARLGLLTGAAGVTLTCNGTAAIELALRARALAGQGRRLCLMPSFTFIASAHAVCNAGLTPYLLDVDPESLAVSPTIAMAALDALTERPAAILVVSAFGAPPDLNAWRAFEDASGIPVVFDAAAAVTSLTAVGDQPLCVSLHATKVLGIGEGGAILCRTPGFDALTQAMAGFGFLPGERASTVRGGNYRMSEYAAAVGLAALDALPERLETIRGLSAGYRERLVNKAAHLQEGIGETWDSMTLNVVVSDVDLEATLVRLSTAGVEWRRWWGLGTHHHPAFADLPKSDLAVTEAIAPLVVGIPFHDLLTSSDLDRITECLL